MITYPDDKMWFRLRRARDKLVRLLSRHSAVLLIGIGREPQQLERGDSTSTHGYILRVHVRRQWLEAQRPGSLSIPDEVDGIPVQVVAADYRLESGAADMP